MPSVVDAVARNVEGLVQLRDHDLPKWLTGMGVPAGWQIARLEGNRIQPSRVAVRGRTPDGTGSACETISLFGFTGMPPTDLVRDNADRTLRALDAAGIHSSVLATPAMPGVIAVRASGYFDASGLPIWAQHSTYLASSEINGRGRLIEHSISIEAGSRAQLNDDIALLSDTVHHAFLRNLQTG
ncbi:hypothetical protein [Mycobacterium shimoidei]|uniref:hypothetical protein n=1 Tax=Mycobacterium shimoidei TaxID=29313 RepID=UPI00111C3D1C|nr:hypothetical protein [Mycobacterium shimoidei]MCV7258802.1 hypothetical protein [Mycobacterium shimoidei]